MKVIGKDRQWHDWDELSAEEQSLVTSKTKDLSIKNKTP